MSLIERDPHLRGVSSLERCVIDRKGSSFERCVLICEVCLHMGGGEVCLEEIP